MTLCYFCALNELKNDMKKLILIATIAIAVCTVTTSAYAQKKSKKDKNDKPFSDLPVFASNIDTVSYLIGNDISRSFKSNAIELNYELLYRGILDAQKGADTLISKEKTQAVLMAFQQEMTQKRKQKEAQEAGVNEAKGMAFLADNKKKDGVIELPSGLQYKVITEGAGDSPKPEDMVTVNYTGKLLDGTVFDATSQRGEPAKFAVNGVIPGWTEGLQLMKPGAKYMFFIPADLAYGEQKTGPIPAGSMLIFEVELISVEKSTPAEAPKE
jgi:FKBP-type peptidyl-prolyl cis-trans isomerase